MSTAQGSERHVCIETRAQWEAVREFSDIGLLYFDEGSFETAALCEMAADCLARGQAFGFRLRRVECNVDEAALAVWHTLLGLRPKALLLRTFDQLGLMALLFDAGAGTEKQSTGALDAGAPDSQAGSRSAQAESRSTQAGSRSAQAENRSTQAPELTDTWERPVLVSDYTIYAYNRRALQVLVEEGIERVCLPIELNRAELRELCADWPARLGRELLVYGHLPMMVSANCLQQTTKGCDRGNRVLALKDRRGKDMPVRCYCKYCYNQIYNAEALVLTDLSVEWTALKPQVLRYDFSVEDAEHVRRILSAPPGKPAGRQFTRGHFHRGVE